MKDNDLLKLEIAVVGLAGRFPGAPSADALWQNLRAGKESIRDLSDEELASAGVEEEERSDPKWVRRAADLAHADRFDAELFGFTPREAELCDPQVRVFLEQAWAALEDAGYLSDRHELRVGVFAGSSPSTYLQNNLIGNAQAADAASLVQASLGNGRDYLATQVAYRLDLRGPGVVVQTACSTSLVAVHLACQSLLSEECDVAVVGGVSVSIPQTSGYAYTEGDIASPDGHCRAFDASAQGVVKGNGCGVLVLRRLAEAQEDGDTIRAVLKGSAVNNDGNLKVGFTAPSLEGQAGVIEEALAVSGVDPATIDYVEAHGTGTPLGDPVEVAALTRAFQGTGRRSKCALGSIKTNIGHLDAAAGVAGLIKTILALQHGEIPASLHFERPNPKLELDRSPFYVNAELRPWPEGEGPRRAGVSSFGIGGTNAHVVVEEAPPSAPSAPTSEMQLLVLSAASETALEAASLHLAERLEQDPTLDLAAVAYTLQVGRKRLAWRRSLVVADREEALRKLRASQALHDERRATNVAFLFPGQGAQHAGMVRTLYAGEPLFRDVLQRCSDFLKPRIGVDLVELCCSESEEATALGETQVTQSALFAVEYALARLWMSWGIQPSAMAGHSIGEYVAACLAGVWSLEDALSLVAERGRLMASMPRGAMLAVHLAPQDLEARLASHPDLDVAAVNGPRACVVSGADADVARFERELASGDVACRRLHTSHAFHSRAMDPILAEFEARVRAVSRSAPRLPFLSNRSGTWIQAEEAQSPTYWAEHLRRSVRFDANLAELTGDATRVLLEVGPGTALTSLARQVAPDATTCASLPGPRSAQTDRARTLKALGELWCAGVDVDWLRVHGDGAGRRIPLPTYAFQRERYWVEPGERSHVAVTENGPEKNPELEAWTYLPGWKRSHVARSEPEVSSPWLVCDEGSALVDLLAEEARTKGVRLYRVARATGEHGREGDTFQLDPSRKADWEWLLGELKADEAWPCHVVHLACASPESNAEAGFDSLLALLQALAPQAADVGLRLVSVTRALFDVTGEAVVNPERATLLGIVRVAPQEFPGLRCRLLDLGELDERSAQAVSHELLARDPEPLVAWRGGHRWVPSYEQVVAEPAEASPAPVRQGGAYLFTGGVGALELGLARRLAQEGAAEIGFLACRGSDRDALESLKESGVRVSSWDAPVWNEAAVTAAVEALRARSDRLDAIFHTAGEIGGGMLQLKEARDVHAFLRPRLAAGFLAQSLREGETLVTFSSSISQTGVFGQVDYCAGSAYLDALAQSHAHRPGASVITVDWGMALWDRWQEASGPGAEALMEGLREVQESIGIEVDEGVEVLWRSFALAEPQVIVSVQDFDEVVRHSRAVTVSDLLEGVGGTITPVRRKGKGGALETETERTVASAWTELLGVGGIGRLDNFFDLGGNSLLAIQLASRLRKEFDIDLTITNLFEATDLGALAASVDRALEERRAAEEIARLLDEIEGLPEEQVLAQLDRGAVDAGADG